MKNGEGVHIKSAGRIIKELSIMAHVYFHSEFKTFNIGHAQIPTLIYISKNEGISQLELAKHLKLDKSSITSQLRILEKNGYISRKKSDKDARVYELKLTEKAHELMEPMKLIFASWTETLFDGFSPDEREQTYQLLERMTENAGRKIKEKCEKVSCE